MIISPFISASEADRLTLIIMANVTVRTKTTDLNALLGGGPIGVDMGICVCSFLIYFSIDPLPFDWSGIAASALSDIVVDRRGQR